MRRKSAYFLSRPQLSPFPPPCDCSRSEPKVRLAPESDDQVLSPVVFGIFGSGDLAGDGDSFPDEAGDESLPRASRLEACLPRFRAKSGVATMISFARGS